MRANKQKPTAMWDHGGGGALGVYGTARQTGKTHIVSPTIPARPPRKLGTACAAVQIYLSAESFFFRNEQFFIVMS